MSAKFIQSITSHTHIPTLTQAETEMQLQTNGCMGFQKETFT